MDESEERYRVERHRGGLFRSWRVMVGDGLSPAFVGTHAQCLRVQQQLTKAYRDGQFMAEQAFVGIQSLTCPHQ